MLDNFRPSDFQPETARPAGRLAVLANIPRFFRDMSATSPGAFTVSIVMRVAKASPDLQRTILVRLRELDQRRGLSMADDLGVAE